MAYCVYSTTTLKWIPDKTEVVVTNTTVWVSLHGIIIVEPDQQLHSTLNAFTWRMGHLQSWEKSTNCRQNFLKFKKSIVARKKKNDLKLFLAFTTIILAIVKKNY